jgi:phosphoserine phosphatase RsbU/P
MAEKLLSQTPPFNSLPLEEIEYLEATMPSVNIEAGEVLLQEGCTDDKFFILMDGQVEIIKAMGTQDERFLGLRGPGTLLGEMSLFTRDGSHSASVRALTPLNLLLISHEVLDSLLQRQPKIMYEIIRMFSRRLESSENITINDLRAKNERLRLAYEELRAAHLQIVEKEKLEKELEIASQIQRSILPNSVPQVRGYDIGVLMVPARYVGGDFYTFFELGDDRLGIVVGDVCDKGIPASLFMALSYSLIRAEAVRSDSPVETLRNANFHLLQMNSMSLFVTLVYGILDCNSGNFHFARLAHPSPFLLDEQGQSIDVPVSPGQPLGLFGDLPIDEQSIYIPRGGTMVLYSDGVSEPEDNEGREFGTRSLGISVNFTKKKPAQDICHQLFEDVQTYCAGVSQQDDFTVVVVKRLLEDFP